MRDIESKTFGLIREVLEHTQEMVKIEGRLRDIDNETSKHWIDLQLQNNFPMRWRKGMTDAEVLAYIKDKLDNCYNSEQYRNRKIWIKEVLRSNNKQYLWDEWEAR